MSLPQNAVTAVLLAGSRPGGDPMAQAAGVPTKALVPVQGRAMVDHVAATLQAHPRIGRVVVLAQDVSAIAAHPQTAWMGQAEDMELRVSGSGISQSLLDLIDSGEALPLLVTTADNVLLTAAMIDDFLGGVVGADVAVAMVERRVLSAAYPESKRTWLKFRGGWWSGANLFWLGSHQARSAIAFWRGVEQDRKKGWKIVSAFGPWLLLGAATRLLTLPGALARAGRRLGVRARLVPMPQAEACIDVDKPSDLALVETILSERSAGVAQRA
jgi:GTP:adenosylcobinamide-phosphate guanylyltransferase